MVLKETWDGQLWTWVEKNGAAALLLEDRLVWRGSPSDPIHLIKLNRGLPAEHRPCVSLLLKLSIRRKRGLT